VRKAYVIFSGLLSLILVFTILCAVSAILGQGGRESQRILEKLLMSMIMTFGILFSIGMVLLPFADMYFSFLNWKLEGMIDEYQYGFGIFKSRKKGELGPLLFSYPDFNLYERGFYSELTFEGVWCGSHALYREIKYIYDWKYGTSFGLQIQTNDFKNCVTRPHNGGENIRAIKKILSEKLGESWESVYLRKEIPDSLWRHHTDVPIDWRKNWRSYLK